MNAFQNNLNKEINGTKMNQVEILELKKKKQNLKLTE
jgi:hypothetical protein